MNQAELDLFNDKLDTHAKEVERFHGEVANVTRQIANCDKLVRLANAGLSQIDSKIAEAVRVSAAAQQIANEAGAQASAAATVATQAAVTDMVTRAECRHRCRAQDRRRVEYPAIQDRRVDRRLHRAGPAVLPGDRLPSPPGRCAATP